MAVFDLAAALKNMSDSGTGREQIEYIPLAQIDEDPNNFYQLNGLEELAANISLCGLQQPIRVRQKDDGRYIIVSGHRRRAALELLAEDDPERWQEVPCIVERDEVSPSLQQLRLIYANANTRKMSPAEISQQAEQVEKLLYQLKEEGYEFPGRMRDHVAEAVNVSKSKLARLKVIREHLSPVWATCFEKNLIVESTAYELAQLPEKWQSIIYGQWGLHPGSLYANDIKVFAQRFKNVVAIQCKHGLNFCEHSVTMMEQNVKERHMSKCDRCCFNCNNLQNCGKCCPEAAAKKKELKAVAKQASLDAKQKQEERDRPAAEFARTVWDRIGKARLENRVSVEQLFKAQKRFYSASADDKNCRKMETGNGDYSPTTDLPFGYNVQAATVMKIRDVADALGCSIDYLLGRTGRMEIVSESDIDSKPEKVSYSGAGWKTGEPEELGSYLLALRPSGCSVQYEKWSWDGIGWKDFTGYHSDDIDGQIIGWITLPPEVMTE